MGHCWILFKKEADQCQLLRELSELLTSNMKMVEYEEILKAVFRASWQQQFLRNHFCLSRHQYFEAKAEHYGLQELLQQKMMNEAKILLFSMQSS